MIEDALRRLDLEFLGFSIFCNVPEMHEFQNIHGPGALTSLDLWHDYETGNPDTFSAMYQFWLRKPG